MLDKRAYIKWRDVEIIDITGHVPTWHPVCKPTVLLSPRKARLGIRDGCMLIERPSHPGRASRLTPGEVARAMGNDDLLGDSQSSGRKIATKLPQINFAWVEARDAGRSSAATAPRPPTLY